MDQFSSFRKTTVAPEAQPSGADGGGLMFEPAPIGAPGDIPDPGAKPKEQKFLGVGSGMASAMASGAGLATGIAAWAGAGFGSVLGPAGFVIGGIVSAFLGGRKKKPHVTAGSVPKGKGANLEDGAFISSKLSDIGFSNEGSGGGVKAGEFVDQMQALADADDMLYDYLDDAGRKAIIEGFEWSGSKNEFSDHMFADRYIKMLTFAADSSPKAAAAKSVIDTAIQDYGYAFESIKDSAPDYVQELYNLQLQKQHGEAVDADASFKEIAGFDRASAKPPEYIGEFSGYSEGAPLGSAFDADRAARGTDIDSRIAALKERALADLESGALSTDAAYESYKSKGGVMPREIFDKAFAGQYESLIHGVDPRSAPSAFDAKRAAAKDAATSGGDITAMATALHVKDGARGVAAGTYSGEGVPIGVGDILTYALLGMQGNSYADIVNGNIRQAAPTNQPAQSASSFMNPGAADPNKTGLQNLASNFSSASDFMNARGGFKFGG